MSKKRYYRSLTVYVKFWYNEPFWRYLMSHMWSRYYNELIRIKTKVFLQISLYSNFVG
jgi:hypothetical protein